MYCTKVNYEQHVENRLQHWAIWCCKNCDAGIGYPRRSTEGRLLDEGFIHYDKYTQKLLPSDENAEEIEYLVTEMAQFQSEIAQAIRMQYVERGTQSSKAKALGISLSQFKMNVQMGRAWISGRLLSLKR